MKKPLWIPSVRRIDNSNIIKYIKWVNKRFKLNLLNYNGLYDWSIENIEDFWASIWKYGKIRYSKKYDSVLTGKTMLSAKWFNGSRLNFAENLLRYKDNRKAVISIRENLPNITITYKELNDFVTKVTYSLKKMGVKKGDRVAGFVNNTPESIIAMLAVTSLGAIWSSCSPDFGIKSIFERFNQIKPKILFAVEEYSYNGILINCYQKISQINKKISSIEKIVLIPRFTDFYNYNNVKKSTKLKGNKYIYFNKLLRNRSSKLNFVQTSFAHPVYILYSSGTTGVPKCIVHGAGGTLLQHFKELSLHTNLKRSDNIFYFTTCGWMMWNWLVSSLLIGSTIVLFDGNPAYPNLNILWELVDEVKITVFGTSPKFLSICEKKNVIPKNISNLNSLKTILSTGSPISRDNFKWVYKNLKKDVQLSSISGGTDIISCFMLGNPILPVYSEEIQSRGLGMKVESFDEFGKNIKNKKGELVCTAPFPSMPVSFWNDKKGKKYKSAYFEKYPGVWHHGDYIKITKKGGVIVYGRSDATLNPGGVRIGTAEIYRIVESINEISDSLVIGQKFKNDVRVILFIVLNIGVKFSKKMEFEIKNKIRSLASPRHVPACIYNVKEIPRTISGKKVEIAVTKLSNGEKVNNKDVLSNPNSLNEFEKLFKK